MLSGKCGVAGGREEADLPFLCCMSGNLAHTHFLREAGRAMCHCGRDTAVSPDRSLALLRVFFSHRSGVFIEPVTLRGMAAGLEAPNTLQMRPLLYSRPNAHDSWESKGRLITLGMVGSWVKGATLEE